MGWERSGDLKGEVTAAAAVGVVEAVGLVAATAAAGVAEAAGLVAAAAAAADAGLAEAAVFDRRLKRSKESRDSAVFTLFTASFLESPLFAGEEYGGGEGVVGGGG